MTPETYVRLTDLFSQASELGSDERASFLDRECAGDCKLRLEIECLLAMDDPAGLAAPDERRSASMALSESEQDGRPQIEGYELQHLLGEGGMGEVWRARQQSTSREVALKFIRTLRLGSSDARARFQREIELAARLNHPHIAAVYDSGAAGDCVYYAMELVEGVRLDRYVSNHRLSESQRVELMLRVARAVQHAHQRGVIHRDLKPSNILVTGDAIPMLVDFGLAKSILCDPDEATFVTQGIVLGTPAYMAPEQAAGEPGQVDTRSDVYSLGVILYSSLTGSYPHDMSGSPVQTIRRIADDAIVPPRAAKPDIDRDLEAILLKALARVPNQRYSTAGELADDLERFLQQEPIGARVPSILYVLRKQLWKYRRAVAAAVLMLVLAAAAIVAYIGMTRRHALVATRLAAAAEQGRRTAVAAERRAQRIAYVHRLEIARGALSNFQFRRAAAMLDECPPDLRGWEWRLLRRQARPTDRSYSTIGPFADGIFRMEFSPDGKQLAIATAGSTTIAAQDAVIVVCHTDTSEIVAHLRGHTDGIFALTFTPDGRQILSGGRDQTLRRWDAQTGELLEAIAPRINIDGEETALTLFAARFSPSGDRIAFAAYPHGLFLADVPSPLSWQSIWDASEHVVQLSGEDDWINFSPDGRRLAWSTRIWQGNRGRLFVIDPVASKVLTERPLASGEPAYCIAFDPSGSKLVTAGMDEKITLYRDDLADAHSTFTGHEGPVHQAFFIRDGKGLISFGVDGLLRTWDVANRNVASAALAADDDSGGVLAISPDGETIAVATQPSNVVRLWRLVDVVRAPSLLVRHGPKARDVAISANGKYVATAGGDGVVNVFDWPERSLRWSAKGDLPNATAVAFSPDSKLLVIGRSVDPAIEPELPCGQLTFVEAATGQPVRPPMDIPGWVWRIRFGPLGQRLVVADGVSPIHLPQRTGAARIIDWPSGQTLRVFPVKAARCRSVVVTPSLDLLAAVSEESIAVWDVSSGTKLAEHIAQSGRNFVELLVGGNQLVTGNENTVEIRDMRTLEVVRSFHSSNSNAPPKERRLIGDVAIHPDAAGFAAASWNGNLTLWNFNSPEPLLSFRAHLAGIHRAIYSPDGRYLISVGHDGAVHVWDGDGD